MTSHVHSQKAALVDKNGYGVGVVNHNADVFLGGFSATKGAGTSSSVNSGYLAPIANVQIQYNATYTYISYLVLGNIETIRSFAEQTRPGATLP